MPQIRYKVTLSEEERERLREMTTRGKHSSQNVLNALILLGCDEGPFQERKLRAEEIANVLLAPELLPAAEDTRGLGAPAGSGRTRKSHGVESQTVTVD